MFKQLRDLFRRTETVKEALSLSIDDLPEWLDAREEDIEHDLQSATASSREAITNTLEHLREAIARMETADADEGVHPRLQDISKKALPRFTKSMGQILSREPSDDPEAFYSTSADILKSALKTLKGQGKYLSTSYPERMKEVRTGVRDLGREINAMTEAITRARTDRQKVEDTQKTYELLVRAREEYIAADDQVREHEAVIGVVEREIRKAESDLAALKSHPDYARKQEIEEKIQNLDALDEEAGRDIASLRSPVIHVFRKAGKVAEKAGDSATTTAIDRALDACTGDLSGDDTLVDRIEAVMPAVLAMIRREDLLLKNQDEIRLFSDVETLPVDIRRALRRQREIKEQRAALQETHAALPVVADERRLTTALAQLKRDRDMAAAARTRSENQRDISQALYARERENLLSRAATLADREVTIDIPDLPLPSSEG